MHVGKILLVASVCVFVCASAAAGSVTFDTRFEGGSLGKVETLGKNRFRCHVEGQKDERGRNRQASWYFFRMENVKGREIEVTLTDFVGEYNDKPGAVPMNEKTLPVFSNDGVRWRHFPAMDWDNTQKEAILRFRPEGASFWIAHTPPYTHSRLLGLLAEIGSNPCARVEVIGKSVKGRDLHLVTVTDFDEPDAGKKVVWLQARQHGWETGTSFVMEGALRFITAESSEARELRKRVVFKFTPMPGPDGAAEGKVRFNANGYDLNRHWNTVDLRRPEFLQRIPETWYAKKAILACLDAGQEIALLVNMHNTETAEYLETPVSEGPAFDRLKRLHEALVARSTFDPPQPLRVSKQPEATTNSLYRERKIPIALMEQRISAGAKLGRQPTIEDRLTFGEQLITVMAEVSLASAGP
jgi:hypothetical protein